MTLVGAFVARPIATIILAMGLLAFGVASFALLPVAALPEVEYPVITVSAELPGAAAETMASAIAAPLERQLAQVDGVEALSSSSTLGSTLITLQFKIGRDLDRVASDVQSAILNASGDLPRDLPHPPAIDKSNPADRPMVILGFSSPVMTLTEVNRYVDTIIVPRVTRFSGVGRTVIANEHKHAVRVRINPIALASRNLSPEDVREAIQRATLNRPKGRLTGIDGTSAIEANDQLFDAAGFDDVVVAVRGGAIVHLADVAAIEDSVENDKTSGWYDNRPAIIVGLMKRAGTNLVEAVDTVRRSIGELRMMLPPAIEMNVIADRAEVIRASLHEIELTLTLTVVVVVVVIFLFLRSLAATFVPAVVIPLSLLATFIAMLGFGYSLDNLSLMALTIAVGFVVDDAIVVLENIARHMEQGESPAAAAVAGSTQVMFTIVSMTASLVAVFIPVMFMDGVVGRLFREFAVTVSVAILASAVISLCITPSLCALMLRPVPRRRGPIGRKLMYAAERGYTRLFAAYGRSLDWVLRHRATIMTGFVVIVGVNIGLFLVIPKGFFPDQDNGRIYAALVAPPSTPFSRMTGIAQRVTTIVRSDPEVYSVTSYVGIDGDENRGVLIINLQERERRHGSVQQVIGRLRTAVAEVSEARLFMQPEPEIITGTSFGRTEYGYTMVDTDRRELDHWADVLLGKLKGVPGLVDVSREEADRAINTRLIVNRELAARLGIDPQLIDETLYDCFGGRKVAEIFTEGEQYYAILEVAPAFEAGASALQYIRLPSRDGRQVPLSALVTMESRAARTAVTHRGQYPAEVIDFNLLAGVSIGTVVDRLREMERASDKPVSLQTSLEGAAREFEESLASEPRLIGAAVLVVYIVLGMLYESFVHPLTILSSLPSAGVGALIALAATGGELDVIGLVGIILLIGIVKKNAIMMVDFAIAAERKGLSPAAAIHEACLARFRPIMMTTAAAILGALPLALGTGAGSELRRPLGIAIVGGLLVSQTLTLYTTPVIHIALWSLVRFLRESTRVSAREMARVIRR